MATFDPGKGASVKVIHEAREFQDNNDPDQAKRTTVAFDPRAMVTLTSKPDANGQVAQRVLLVRWKRLAPHGYWPPLVVDPQTSAVEVVAPLFRMGVLEKSRSHEGAVYGWIDKEDNKPSHILFRITYPGTLKEVWPSMPVQGRIRFVGDRLNIIGDKWWTGSLARKGIHPVRDMPPEVADVFPSAHYGLIFSSFDRRNKKFTTYQVVFNERP